MDEKDVAEKFRRCKFAEGSKKNGLLIELYKKITSPEYRDGEIAHIIRGGVACIALGNCATGYLKIPPLHILHWKYSEIDWELYVSNQSLWRHLSPRFLYLATVLSHAFRRKTSTFESLELPVHLVHLNSYLRVPLYSLSAVRGATATLNHNYGFHAVYTAEAMKTDDEHYALSGCSVDVVQERGLKGQIYNRGYLFSFKDYRDMFYVDRRANVELQNGFLQQAASMMPGVFGNAERCSDSLKRHEEALNQAIAVTAVTKGIEPKDALDEYLRLTRELEYSLLGACLFDLLHEFLMERLASIQATNEILQSLDPKQKEDWSTRAFCLDSKELLESLFKERLPRHDNLYDEFLFFFADQIGIRLRAALAIKVEDTYNSVSGVSAWAYNCEMYRHQYYINNSPSGSSDFFAVAGDMMSSYLLQVIAHHELGVVAIPFQPDSRGEFLLLPGVAGKQGADVFRVRLDLRDSPPKKLLVEARDEEADVFITPCGETNRHLYPVGFLSKRERDHQARYKAIFGRITDTLEGRASLLAKQFKDKKAIAGIIVPFFKEDTSFADVAAFAVRSLVEAGATPLLILATNQFERPPLRGSQRLYLDSIGMVVERIGEITPNLRLGADYWISPIQTSEINGLNHWMIEKFCNIHAGMWLARRLRQDVEIDAVFVLEGDIQSTEHWWQNILKHIDSDNQVLLFDFQTGVRSEREDGVITCDYHSSDALLARFITEPLTHEILGVPLRNLLGGNYALKGDAIDSFATRLDQSDHTESLLEIWLLDLAVEHPAEVIYVGDKVHLPAVQQFKFSTDEQFVKACIDIFDGVRRVETKVLGQDRAGTSFFVTKSSLRKMRFSNDDHDTFLERVESAMNNLGYSTEILQRILPNDLRQLWEQILGSVHDAMRNGRLAKVDISEAKWRMTVRSFYNATAVYEPHVKDELLFVLKNLFTVFLLRFEVGKEVDIKAWANKVGLP